MAATACDSDGWGALLLSAGGATPFPFRRFLGVGVGGTTATVSLLRGTLASVLPILPLREGAASAGVPAAI